MIDYKSEWVESKRLRQENSIDGWIYIGVDTRFDNMAKVGLTTGRLGTRASGSQNPSYALLCAFKIKEGVASKNIKEIENAVIDFLSESYKRIPHKTSGRFSEWFYVKPSEMREHVQYFLSDNYRCDMRCYYCSVRDIDVIYSWENTMLLERAFRSPYQANDLSSPPVDPACFMQGGCGAGCDCDLWG